MNNAGEKFRFIMQILLKWLFYIGCAVLAIALADLVRIGFDTYNRFPVSPQRDWLSRFADLGQAVGGFAVLAIILEVYKFSKSQREEKKQRIPKIQVNRTVSMQDSCPHAGTVCLNETSVTELPKPEELEKGDSYRELWFAMGAPSQNNGNKYLKIDISNTQTFPEANIVDLQLQIRLKYGGENSRQDGAEMTFWCPAANGNFRLEVGKSDSLYVRCGKLADSEVSKVSGEILEIRCTTATRDIYLGKSIGFSRILIPPITL